MANLKLRAAGRFMQFSNRHNRLARLLFAPCRLPFVRRRLPVAVRAALGESAFEIHDIDRARGRIAIGAVDEVLTGSVLIQRLHHELGAALGPAEAAAMLYRLGESVCRWEVSEAFGHGRWADPALAGLVQGPTLLDDIARDPDRRRLFAETIAMMVRMIAEEGGWGRLEFDFISRPLRVWLDHSQEASWHGPADHPVCHYFAGIVAGYGGSLACRRLVAREVECAAMGASRCLFELHESDEAPPPVPVRPAWPGQPGGS